MGNKKYMAVVLVVFLVNVVALVKAQDDFKSRQENCYNYCYSACIFPSKFCSWECGLRCKNPVGFDSSLMAVPGGKPGGKHDGEHYPVPTEEEYKNYLKTHPEEDPSKKHSL